MKLLVLILGCALSLFPNYVYSKDYCTPPTKQEGLIIPNIPLNSYMQYETWTSPNKEISNYEALIDANGLKVGAKYTSNGVSFRLVSDAKSKYAVLLTQEGAVETMESLGHGYSCQSLDIPLTYAEMVMDVYKKSLFYNHQFAYDHTGQWRGSQVNFFTGCNNYDLPDGKGRASYKVEYGFLPRTVDSPSGFQTAPFMMNATGQETSKNKTVTQKAQTNNYYYFDVARKKYDNLVRIPDGVYCDGFQNVKPFPQINLTSMIVGIDSVLTTYTYIMGAATRMNTKSNHIEYLSQEMQLERLDFIPDSSFLKGIYQGVPITVVRDKKTDASFIISKKNKTCTLYKRNVLSETSISKYKFIDNVLFLKLNNAKYQYKGEEPCGDAMCDVWITEAIDSVPYQQVKPVTRWTELRYLTDDWYRETYRGSSKKLPIELVTYFNTTVASAIKREKVTLRLYNYNERPLNLLDFKLDNCLIDDNTKYYTITLNVHKCPLQDSFYYQGNCIIIFSESATFDQANSTCISHGGVLFKDFTDTQTQLKHTLLYRNGTYWAAKHTTVTYKKDKSLIAQVYPDYQTRIEDGYICQKPMDSEIESLEEEGEILLRNAVAKELAKAAQIDLLRIQNVQVVYHDAPQTIALSFTMMNAYATPKMAEAQVEVELALIHLKGVVDTAGFTFTLGIDYENTSFTTQKGSVKDLLPKNNAFESSTGEDDEPMQNYRTLEPKGKKVGAPNPKQKSGYGKGPLAACIIVMLLVGLVFGALITLIYFRKFYYSTTSQEDDEGKTFAMDDIGHSSEG